MLFIYNTCRPSCGGKILLCRCPMQPPDAGKPVLRTWERCPGEQGAKRPSCKTVQLNAKGGVLPVAFPICIYFLSDILARFQRVSEWPESATCPCKSFFQMNWHLENSKMPKLAMVTYIRKAKHGKIFTRVSLGQDSLFARAWELRWPWETSVQ